MSATDSLDRITRKEAANYLTSLGYQLSAKSLANLASNDNALKGPPFYRYGWRTIRYSREDLRIWFEARVTRVV